MLDVRTKYNRGCLLADEGQHAEAEVLCREVAAAQAAVLGHAHPDVVRTQKNLSELTNSGEFITLPTPAGWDGAATNQQRRGGSLSVTPLQAEKLRQTRRTKVSQSLCVALATGMFCLDHTGNCGS